MSSVIFLDVLAYLGAILIVCVLLYLGGVLLMGRATARGLAAFIGQGRAEQQLRNGAIRPVQMRAAGGVLLMVGGFLAACVVRGILHV